MGFSSLHLCRANFLSSEGRPIFSARQKHHAALEQGERGTEIAAGDAPQASVQHDLVLPLL